MDADTGAVGSLERQLMPQVRRFHDLGGTAEAPEPPLEPIGQLVRSMGTPAAAEPPAPEDGADARDVRKG